MAISNYCNPTSQMFDHVRHVNCDRRIYNSYTESIKDGCACPCHAGEPPTHYTLPPLTAEQRAERPARYAAARDAYVNGAPGYQSAGARLLRGVMFANTNPPIVEQVSAETLREREALR